MWGINLELFSERFLSLPPATFLTLPLLILLCRLRLLDQIVDLQAAEHLAEKRIIIVLLPQSSIIFFESIIAGCKVFNYIVSQMAQLKKTAG